MLIIRPSLWWDSNSNPITSCNEWQLKCWLSFFSILVFALSQVFVVVVFGFLVSFFPLSTPKQTSKESFHVNLLFSCYFVSMICPTI